MAESKTSLKEAGITDKNLIKGVIEASDRLDSAQRAQTVVDNTKQLSDVEAKLAAIRGEMGKDEEKTALIRQRDQLKSTITVGESVGKPLEGLEERENARLQERYPEGREFESNVFKGEQRETASVDTSVPPQTLQPAPAPEQNFMQRLMSVITGKGNAKVTDVVPGAITPEATRQAPVATETYNALKPSNNPTPKPGNA